MLRIKKISSGGTGVRGRVFTAGLERPIIFIGQNGSGKTSRLLAVQAALGERRRGGLPEFLGDDVDAVGSVLASVELCDHGGFSLTASRTLGAKHSLTVDRNGVKTTKIGDSEDILDAELGRRRPEIVPASRFIALDEKGQRAVLEKLAGSAVDEILSIKALSSRFGAVRVESEDEGAPTVAFSADKVSMLTRAIVDSGGLLEPARDMLKSWAKEVRAANASAKKAREQFEKFDSPTAPGSLPELDAKIAAKRARISELDGEIGAVKQAARRAAEISQAKVQATARKAEVEADLHAARSVLVDRQAEFAAAEKAAAACRERLSSMPAPGGQASGDAELLKRLSAEIEQLRKGSCPLCGQAGPMIRAAMIRKARIKKDIESGQQGGSGEYEAVSRELDALNITVRRADSGVRQAEDALVRLEGTLQGLVAAAQADTSDAVARSTDDLEEERAAVAEELAVVAGSRDALIRQQEQESLRVRNLAEIYKTDATMRLIAKAGEVLDALADEISRVAHGPVEKAVNEVLDYLPIGLRFSFRREPFGFGATRGTGFIPYASLSESQQLLVGLAMSIAIDKIENTPFRPLLLDGLEKVDPQTVVALCKAASKMMADGMLSNFAATLRCDSLEDFKATYGSDLDFPLDVELISLDEPGGLLAFSADGARESSPLGGKEYVFCTGVGGDRQDRMTVEAHRARGCPCGAEEAEMRKRILKDALKNTES